MPRRAGAVLCWQGALAVAERAPRWASQEWDSPGVARLVADIKFFGRHKRGPIRDGVILSAQVHIEHSLIIASMESRVIMPGRVQWAGWRVKIDAAAPAQGRYSAVGFRAK